MRKLILTTIILPILVICVEAQQNPVHWSIKTSPPVGAMKAGDKLAVQVVAEVEAGWYFYSITQPEGGPTRTSITLSKEQPFKLVGVIKGPKPKSKFDESFGINTEAHDGTAVFTLPLQIAASAEAGKQKLLVNVRFQACNNQICLPPKTVELAAPVEIVAGNAAVTSTEVLSSPTPTPTASPKESVANVAAVTNSNVDANSVGSAPIETANTNSVSSTAITAESLNIPPPSNLSNGGLDLDSSLWAFIWAAAIAGALSLLTPCVFPMIPITVSYFTNHSEGSRGKATKNAFVFAVGIIFTFTVLGMLLALLFGAAGINKFAANPYINILIAGLFITFALSLFGAFNLGLPPTLLTKLDSISRGRESSQVLGLLLMGLVFSVTTFTCTAPLLGGLFVLATQGNWFYPIVGMLAFSSVFALPFFILALAPQLLAQLPRSGGWLNSVKVVMGFLEVAAAMKFISNVDLVWSWGIFTREVVLASWVAVALLIVLYLLGVFHFSHDTKDGRIGAIRAMVSFVFLSLCIYLLTGLFGQNMRELESFLPPKVTNSTMINSEIASAKNPACTNR